MKLNYTKKVSSTISSRKIIYIMKILQTMTQNPTLEILQKIINQLKPSYPAVSNNYQR